MNYTQEEIKKTIKVLEKFLKDSSVSGKDLKKYWIIDKKEERALVITITLLKDCI